MTANARGILRVAGIGTMLPVLLAACLAHPPPPVSERSLIEGPRPEVYTVQKYDTLYSVAWRYELDVEHLASLNGIEPPYLIETGQRIALTRTARAGPLEPAKVPAASARVAPVEPHGPAAVPAPPAATAADEGSGVAPPSVKAPSAKPTPAAIPSVVTRPPTPNPVVLPERPVTPRASATPDGPTVEPPSKPAAANPAVGAKPKATAPRNASPPASGRTWRSPVAAKPTRGFGGGSKGNDYTLPRGTEIRAASAGTVVYAGPGLGGFRHLVIVKASERLLVAYGVNVQPKLKDGQTVGLGDVVAQAGSGRTGGQFHFEIRERANDGTMNAVDPRRFIGG